ncbi:MAG: DUF5305 family protein [Sulfolobales archaeon]
MAGLNRIGVYMLIASITMLSVGVFIAAGAFTRDPYVVSERTIYRVERISTFNLTFYLLPNEIYEEEILSPIPNSTPIYLSLVRELLINYTYVISQGSARGVIRISVLLIHPDGWSKRYLEIPIDVSSNRASESFSINLTGASELMTRLSKQVMARSDSYVIRISANIDTTLSIQQYSRRDLEVHSIELPVYIGYNKVDISGNLTSGRTFEDRERNIITAMVMGMPVGVARNISLGLTIAGVSLLAISIAFRSLATRARKPEEILERRFSQLIVEVGNSRLPLKGGKNIVYIEKPEELVKLSRMLEKPILRECLSREKCEYYIVDQDVTYMLRASEEGSSAKT